MSNQYKTSAVRTLDAIIRELAVTRFEIDEELIGHRLNVRVRPAKLEDYLCVAGKGYKMFRDIRTVIMSIANLTDEKVLVWDEVTRPEGNPGTRYKKLFNPDREESSVRDLAEAVFGYRDEVEFKRVDRANVVYIVIGHAESQKELAKELKEPLENLIALVGVIHNMTLNLTLIPSAFEKEIQPATAAGRFTGEIKP